MKLSWHRLFTDGSKTWERHPNLPWVFALGWLIGIGWLAFFWHLGHTGLLDETEPLFAEAARQMTVTGDWITPYFNQVTRFDKPPLIYWLMAIAYQTFGVNAWAARLPSALAGFCLMGACFYVLQRFGLPVGQEQLRQVDPESPRFSFPWQLWLTAGLGSVMVALHPQTLFFGRLGYSDMVLNACMSGSLMAFFLGYAQPERQSAQQRWYLAFYVLMALAVLTKGPVAIALPGLIIGAFLFYVGRLREVLAEINWRRGVLIVLGLCLPWFILVTLSNGEAYLDAFFGYHNLERFTSVVNRHQGPWYFHFLVVLVGFAPWSVYLPSAIAHLHPLQRQNWQNQARSNHLGIFVLFWFWIVLIFFTIAATKYFSYVLPLMPAAAMLVALWWSQQIGRAQILQQQSRSLGLSNLASVLLFVGLAIACFYCPNWLNDDASMPQLGERIQQAGLATLGAAIWGTMAVVGTFLMLRRQNQWLWGVNFLGFVAFLSLVLLPATSIVDTERQLPLRQIAETVTQVRQPDEPLLMTVDGFEKPSLVFYTQQPVIFILPPVEVTLYIQEKLDRQTLKSALLVATDRALVETGLSPSQYQAVSRAGIYQLIRITKTGGLS